MGNSVKDPVEYILAHELAGHAVPMITTKNLKEGKNGNAVDTENQIREETNEKQRRSDPNHTEW